MPDAACCVPTKSLQTYTIIIEQKGYSSQFEFGLNWGEMG